MVFFFNDTATTEIYPLSLHDALPICFAASTMAKSFRSRATRKIYWALVAGVPRVRQGRVSTYLAKEGDEGDARMKVAQHGDEDRKSTRLNSSHVNISYAVFCLKKKNLISTATYLVIRYVSS